MASASPKDGGSSQPYASGAATAVAAVVAIDGPAGAGKSTVARALADRLGFFLLDTGAIYRAVALCAKRRGLAYTDGPRLGELAAALDIRFSGARVILGDDDVSDAIRTAEMSQGASTVSAHPEVRAALLELQRRLASQGRCVVEGRDIGTVVLPWAPLKFFLTARDEVRARRRYEELVERGQAVDFAETLAELRERDHRDTHRATAPLKQADDALLLDTSDLSLDQVISEMVKITKERLVL
jgi:cytidylate kinase